MAKIPTSDKDSDQDSSVAYKECWKNHAVLIGGFAADGCGEFIPKGTEGTRDGLICEACGCHRNFHRKEVKRNGVVVVGSHHLPPIWAQINEVCVSSDPFSSSFCCYKQLEDSGDVSDEESVVCSAQPAKKLSD